MKDYLNADEKNQIMVFMSILQIMNGNRGINGPKIITVLEDWDKRGNLTKDEHKNLKAAGTYLTKFCKSVYDRLSDKEKVQIDKRLQKFDFRLVDDYTMQKIQREINDRMVNAAVPRQLFYKWCEEIMECNCKGCTKDWKECELHQVFEENFVPESTWNLDNCRYAYGGEKIAEENKKRLENIKFHRIARKAKRAENKGNFKEEGRLQCILEENNRCLCCGSEQFFDEKYYKEYGMWKCPECDGQ